MLIAAAFILIFFTVYASSCFVTCGKLFSTLFGAPYVTMMIVGAVFVLLYTLLGVVVFVCSVVLGIHSLWQKFTGHALEGFTTVILLQLIIGSILMICLGIIGYYIAKIYEEIKDRPRYIVADRCEGRKPDGQAEKDI